MLVFVQNQQRQLSLMVFGVMCLLNCYLYWYVHWTSSLSLQQTLRWVTGLRKGKRRLQYKGMASTQHFDVSKVVKDGTSSSLAYARHWKVSAKIYGLSARCQLIMWLGGMLLSSTCDRSVPALSLVSCRYRRNMTEITLAQKEKNVYDQMEVIWSPNWPKWPTCDIIVCAFFLQALIFTWKRWNWILIFDTFIANKHKFTIA